MTVARKNLVSFADTQYYHITDRCVRRAFLCGYDRYSNRNFEHRRGLIVDRMKLLSTVFAIDVWAYTVLSNHYHMVIKVNPKEPAAWSTDEVIQRWQLLFKGDSLVQRYQEGESLSSAERFAVSERIEQYRKRLCDLSWFAKCLNEYIAREANKEDGCKGKFWESRFSSQALLDEEAVLTAMAYVDLNPIRASMAETPETSNYTSIQERIQLLKNPDSAKAHKSINQKILDEKGFIQKPLVPFVGSIHLEQTEGIPYSLENYLELVDWTGRAIREDKRGSIPNHLPSILTRLNLDAAEWLENCQKFESRYCRVVGRLKRVQRFIKRAAQKWCHGQETFEKMFANGSPSRDF